MRFSKYTIAVVAMLTAPFTRAERPFLSPMFSSHMILQRDVENAFWGWTQPGTAVRVILNGKTFDAMSGSGGKWRVTLPAMPAGGPYQITVEGPQRVTFDDVLFGDVWLCSGQSNMGFNVSSSLDGRNVVKTAADSQIRLLTIPNAASPKPLETFESGTWQVCLPDAVKNFSAVGYFFGKELRQELNVPIGLIHSSWGGTLAEAWTSSDALKPLGDFDQAMMNLEQKYATVPSGSEDTVETWYRNNDAGSGGPAPAWAAVDLDDTGWPEMVQPHEWQTPDLADFDGVVWLRKTFHVSASQAGKVARLKLGAIDDEDTVWVNGRRIGSSHGYAKLREYEIPSGVLKKDTNLLAVRILDRGYGGGMAGPAGEMTVRSEGEVPLSLSGAWKYRIGANLKKSTGLPMRLSEDPHHPSVLYNAMISPLRHYGIKGAIWYQGEGNASRAQQYRKLLPTMIGDWRSRFEQGDFPFYIVQLANFSSRQTDPGESDWAELREAQAVTAETIANAGLAVTIDIGEANDIHPKNKQDVGKRLALAALAGTYGKKVERSGPVFQSAKFDRHVVRLGFDHADSGLMAKGALKGFSIAGPDRKFFWAEAVIEGPEVLLSSPQVDVPVAARYAWANNPEATLYNKSGLPAAPFRTDSWPGLTDGKK